MSDLNLGNTALLQLSLQVQVFLKQNAFIYVYVISLGSKEWSLKDWEES